MMISAVLRMSDRRSSSLFVWLVLSWTGSVMSSIPIVTWHGLGGTQSECDRMIDTIRSYHIHTTRLFMNCPCKKIEHINSKIFHSWSNLLFFKKFFECILLTSGMAKVDKCSVSCIKDQTDLNKSTVNAAVAVKILQ